MFSVCTPQPLSDFTKMVVDMVNELEAVNDPTSMLASTFHVALPSSSIIGEFWPESQQSVALPHDLQRAVPSPLAAIYISLSILLAVTNAGTLTDGRRAGPSSLEHHKPWIFDSTLKLWQYFRRWSTSSDKHMLRDETISIYLRLLETVIFPETSSEDDFSNSPKAAQAFADSLSSLITSASILSLSVPNQIRLASLITRLRNRLTVHAKSAPVVRPRQAINQSVILDDLEASITRTCHHVERFSRLDRDLQVCPK